MVLIPGDLLVSTSDPGKGFRACLVGGPEIVYCVQEVRSLIVQHGSPEAQEVGLLGVGGGQFPKGGDAGQTKK